MLISLHNFVERGFSMVSLKFLNELFLYLEILCIYAHTQTYILLQSM